MAKRPRDSNQLAKLIVDISTGAVEKPDDPNAPKRGRAGGLKGGRARADALSSNRRVQIGCWYATSEQVPGFLLCDTDKQRLDADVFPAMKQLLEIKGRHQPAASAKKHQVKELVERREFALAA